MDYKYIEQLLERYWACETSLQEESILRNFFAQSDVPAHLQPYQSLFQCETEMAEERLSDDFEERVMAQIEQREQKVQTASPAAVKARRMHLSYGLRPFFKAAAVVAVVLSLSMAVQQAMDHDHTPNVVTLPPAVVPGAPETAYGTDKPVVDTLTNTQFTPPAVTVSK